MPDIDVDVSVSGPIFDGRFEEAVKRGCVAAERELGAHGYDLVMSRLQDKIQHPTPYYETMIDVQKLAGATVVHDRDIVYGPWLEGTSQRNQETSFEGYRAFGLAGARLQQDAPALVSHTLGPYIQAVT